MPNYLIQPQADHTADPTDLTNALWFFNATDPDTLAGLTNGTAYVAREFILSPASAAFTPAVVAASLARATTVQGVTHDTGQNSWPYEGNSITVSGGANRLLVAIITINAGSNGVDLSDLSATFGDASRSYGVDDTAMTVLGPFTTGRRVQTAIAVLVNPPSGAGTVMFSSAGVVTAGNMVTVEYTGASQTLANHTAFTANGGTSITSTTTSGTAVAGQLLSGVAILNGDYTAEVAATGGATLLGSAVQSGVVGFAGLTSAFSTEVVTAGANGNGFSWTTANDAIMTTLMVAAA